MVKALKADDPFSLIEAEAVQRLPFLTGSRAYGTPRDNSDVDVVCLMSLEQTEKLLEAFVVDPDTTGKHCIKLGQLNLVLVNTEEEYDGWLEGTQELKARSPVTRDEAIEVFNRLGVTGGQSGG